MKIGNENHHLKIANKDNKIKVIYISKIDPAPA